MKVKEIKWGHLWKTRSENIHQCIEHFWDSLGRKWTKEDCLKDFDISKATGAVGKSSKIEVYEVILRRIDL